MLWWRCTKLRESAPSVWLNNYLLSSCSILWFSSSSFLAFALSMRRLTCRSSKELITRAIVIAFAISFLLSTLFIIPLNLYKNQPLSSKIPTFLFQKNIPRSARGITKLLYVIFCLYYTGKIHSYTFTLSSIC